jgi:hypothetical protein
MESENYYEDLEIDGPVEEENFLPVRPTSSQHPARDKKRSESLEVSAQ